MRGPHPKWLEQAVFYQIYPQSFYDSNGDGIGDIPGIIEKLDYIQYLGCNALWINPCFESPFLDAGYDISDYYKVAPRYGTNEDLKHLFKEAERRGIHVCLDLVPGHTSIEHPWFRESCKFEANIYTNRYIWTDNPWDRGDGKSYFITGHGERSGSYMPNFFYHQPCLNYGFANPDPSSSWQLPIDHPDVKATREEIKKIMRFWLDMGASGFRVDMAFSLVKNDPDCKQTIALWQEMRQMLDAWYPEAALISEWSMPHQAIPAGFHIDFLLPYPYPYITLFSSDCEDMLHKRDVTSPSVFRKHGRGDIRQFLDAYMWHLENFGDKGYLSVIGCNHDCYRLAYGRDKAELEVIFAFLMTMPGAPFIYYGDEIGMAYIPNMPSREGGYQRTGSRTPMQWTKGPNAGFSSAPAHKLYIPIDDREDYPNVEEQMGRQDSLLELVRSLIALRKDEPALGAEGKFTPVYAESGKYPFVYERKYNDSRVLVALNPTDKAVEVEVDIPADCILLHGKGARLKADKDSTKLCMDGVSYGIYSLHLSR